MLPRRIDMVGGERAARADMVRARRQHEVIDGELAMAAEQIAKRAFALGAFEDIGLLDSDPGQLPALRAQCVEFVRHGTLPGEKRLAGGEPFFARNDGMLHGQSPSVWGVEWVSCRGPPEASFSQGDTWKRLI